MADVDGGRASCAMLSKNAVICIGASSRCKSGAMGA